VKIGLLDVAVFAEVQGDAGVALDAGDGFDRNFMRTHLGGLPVIGFKF
jgi:hypothetical protein